MIAPSGGTDRGDVKRHLARQANDLVERDVGRDVEVVAAAVVTSEREALLGVLGVALGGLLGGVLGALAGSRPSTDRQSRRRGDAPTEAESSLARLGGAPIAVLVVVRDRLLAWSGGDDDLLCDISIDAVDSVAWRQSRVTSSCAVLLLSEGLTTVALDGRKPDLLAVGAAIADQSNGRLTLRNVDLGRRQRF